MRGHRIQVQECDLRRNMGLLPSGSRAAEVQDSRRFARLELVDEGGHAFRDPPSPEPSIHRAGASLLVTRPWPPLR
jgi:hypothetical protein